jgi:hypothetical protein
MQFSGPQHTPNAPFAPRFFYADLLGFVTYSPLSVAGSPGAVELATGPTELNTFFGPVLIALVIGLVIWRRRSPAVVAAATTIVVMAYLSLGETVVVGGRATDLPGLYRPLADLPVISAALPTRYALALIPLIAVILVDALDAVQTATAGRDGTPAAVRGATTGPPPVGARAVTAVPLAAAAALLPLFPLPLPATHREPVPAFITTGAWRTCVPEGGVLVPVPLPTPFAPERMRWPAAANAAFGIPEGFFLGPYGPGGRTAAGTYKRPTSVLLDGVARTGVVPEITPQMRTQARADLAFWRADCVALARVPNELALHSTLERLLGPGHPVAGTWTWPITG